MPRLLWFWSDLGCIKAVVMAFMCGRWATFDSFNMVYAKWIHSSRFGPLALPAPPLKVLVML